MKHVTVLKKEAIDLINPKDGGVYADLTLGGGGHLNELLNRVEKSTILAFDIDSNNIDNVKETLDKDKFEIYDLQFTNEVRSTIDNQKSVIVLINDNFSKLGFYLERLGLEKLDGILADLGWSMDQLESVEGMSYEDKDAQLDMRMSNGLGVKASDLLNAFGKNELSEMFKKYADIYGSQNSKLVDEIKLYRKKRLIETVGDFLKIVDKAFGLQNVDPKGKSRKFQTYSKVFQALRIAVNSEYENLKNLVTDSFSYLNKDGVFAIITFHSGEEKLVSEEFNRLVKEKQAEYVSLQDKNKFIRPSVEELLNNISARSAKLWAIKKN